MSLFFAIFAALFSVVNPLGAMPVYLSLTANYSNSERNKIALRSSIFFVLILIIFFLIGSYLLNFFGISLEAMRIAGGSIIFLSGFALLKGEMAKNRTIDKRVKAEALVKEDISLTPLAIPLLAGPGSISLLISLYSRIANWQEYLIIISVIMAVGLVTWIILLVSPRLVSFFGVAGLNSISRIIGFLVMAIGVEFIITGVKAVVVSLQ